jgi:hypothetical protein
MSEEPTPEETATWQRRLASRANNCAWRLSESPTRTAEDDEEMLQAAYAAMYLWKIVGNARNRAHAEQLLAHVHAHLGQAGPASHYQARSQPFFFGPEAEPWERALAHAVAANVAAANNDLEAHREHFAAAVQLIEALADPEDREILDATLRVLPVPPGPPPAA